MTLKIERIKPEAPRPQVVVDARLCIASDGKRLVPDGHPDAAVLFCIPGRPVDAEEFDHYEVDMGPPEPSLEAIADGGEAAPPPESDGEPEAEAEEAPKPKRKSRKKAADKAVKEPEGDK